MRDSLVLAGIRAIWTSWAQVTEPTRKIQEFRRRIQRAETGRQGSDVLRELLEYFDGRNAFLLSHSRVLQFCDEWGRGFMRSRGEHPTLCLLEDRPALNRLKRDADKLLR